MRTSLKEYNKARYKKAIQEGICISHPQNKVVKNRTRCQKCLDHGKKYNKTRYKKLTATGMCSTHPKRKVVESYARCQQCLDYSNRAHKKAIREGVCPGHTKNKVVKGHKICQQCINYHKEHDKNRHKHKKDIVIKHLGNACTCCGENKSEFLTLSHINDDGAEDRKLRGGTTGIYNYLYLLIHDKKEILKNKYEIKCYNCNLGAATNNKTCPHIKVTNIPKVSIIKNLHKKVLLKYGGVCTSCKETELKFLTIEHINGDGSKEIREKFKEQKYAFYNHLLNMDKRNDIEVLCFNCNCSK